MKNVLVIGNGGREHAIAWKLSQSLEVKKIFVAKGNAGISKLDKVEIVSIELSDAKLVSNWCKTQSISLVVIGPEAPLVTGLADALNLSGIPCFGPVKDAARIESDKSWSKTLMDQKNIPTARWKSFEKRQDAIAFIKSNVFNGYVIKASGLAAGKGVFVTSNVEEAVSAVDYLLTDKKFGSAGDTIVIEEKLDGPEVSVLGFTDGKTVKIMLPAQDHKRVYDGDKGNNTGGMGAYCPCPLITNEQLNWVNENIMKPAVNALYEQGTPFVGVLYAGLMLTSDGIKVLEFNCRFGDPETEVILPLLETDLYTVMEACCNKKLDTIDLKWKENKSAVGVVMASRGYPESSSKGDVIKGIDDVNGKEDILVFHCGTAQKSITHNRFGQQQEYVTDGGRVLVTVALSSTLIDAAARATNACKRIKFDGAHFRTDIGYKGIARSILKTGSLTYKHSGVDINAGDSLVNSIKSLAKSTSVPGVLGGLGGFGALFDLKAINGELNPYNDPLIVSSTDGVGTKLKVAEASDKHDTIGVDLVAMCVNDILAQGAQPLFFLDYYATSKLDTNLAKDVISGIAEGCRQAGCALVGGETAEMPGIYSGNDYDLAGFSVGIVNRNATLPRLDAIRDGDVVIGLPSTGVHSNGFSLVRRIIRDSELSYHSPSPFSDSGSTLGEELLRPTKIYVKQVLPTLQSGLVNAVAHITGGGLLDNIPRVLPNNLKVVLNAKSWNILPVFAWLAVTGGVSETEMLRTFNCGIGLILVTSEENKQKVLDSIPEASVIGTVNQRLSKDESVEVLHFSEVMSALMQPFVKPLISKLIDRKRVAVLLSGSGTNLQALIDGTVGSPYAQIVLVISNNEDAYGLQRAKNANINNKIVNHSLYKTRKEFEEVIDNLLNESGIDIICLAGFMRVLTGWFVNRWRGKLINVHPSLLPAFKGAHPVKDAIEAQVRVTGCTVHFVEEAVDAGCIIGQEAVSVYTNDTEESIFERIHKVEHVLFPESLLHVASGKVKLDLTNNKLVWLS